MTRFIRILVRSLSDPRKFISDEINTTKLLIPKTDKTWKPHATNFFGEKLKKEPDLKDIFKHTLW